MTAESSMGLLVRAMRLEAKNVVSFELVHPQGQPLPPITPGAHIDVYLPGGMVRSYSLAGDPADRDRWVLGVLREDNGKGGSRAMHERVRVGSTLRVSQPRNAFALAAQAQHTVLIGGGIGITPLKAMAHELKRAGASFELHYCARAPENVAFTDEIIALVPPQDMHWHFDGGEPERGLDLEALLAKPAPDTHVYFCGPPGFMAACEAATRHWTEGAVHREYFKVPEQDAPAKQDEGSFTVFLARTGKTITVQPDQTIVRAIELSGERVPTSCMSGLCGTCKVNYLDGEVDHRDYILSDAEKQYCLTTCVSRAKGVSLSLDL